MKKLSLLFLLFFIASCSNEWTENNIQVIEEKYEIVDTLDVSCTQDSDCITPTTYMIQSSCPYTSKCINLQCSVVCPKPFVGKKREDTNNNENWEILSQADATKLIIDNIWDCSKNECDNLEVNTSNWKDWIWYIEAIFDGLKDDSVHAIKRIYTVGFVNGKWELWAEVFEEYKCQKGRWQEDFWAEFCK